VVILYILCGFHRELVYSYLLDSTRIMCMLFVHILLGGVFPKRHRANCGVFAIIRKVSILGRHSLRRYHSCHVRATTLEVSDLVLRRILSCEGLHKLSPMWEGPFKVTHIARLGSARLETAEGVPVRNP
jgi:hypothetical protein